MKIRTKQLKKLNNMKIIKIALLIIVIMGVIWLLTDYIQTKKQVAFLSNPEAQKQARIEADQKELQEIVSLVSKLIILPNEEPNLATIQDAEKLAAQQLFFKDAENGDKILIYKDKAIIFRPAKNILVNVGPVYAQDSQKASKQAPTSTQNQEE